MMRMNGYKQKMTLSSMVMKMIKNENINKTININGVISTMHISSSSSAAAASSSTSTTTNNDDVSTASIRLSPMNASPVINIKDISFNLYQVLNVERNVIGNGLYKELHPRYKDHSRETIDEAIESAEKLSIDKFLPHSRLNDLHEPHYDIKTNKVIINPQVKEAMESFKNAGFCSAHSDNEYGGMQFPSIVTNSLMFPFFAGNVGTSTFYFLSIAAGNMLRKYGSSEQLKKYLQPMLDGKYTGTMNLSETQAGSSLGDITTRAYKKIDNKTGKTKYLIKGNKMWISGGEHSLTDNIVHMVLAKICIDDGKGNKTNKVEPGVKGISLFIVPKYKLNDKTYEIEKLNDVSLGGLNHKMGWRGATNCVMNYGDNDECEGELLGEEGKGLSVMFMMMNEARISIGLIATALGYAGYNQSLKYSKERKQGRDPNNKDPTLPQISIISHSDVKRMLLAQKSYVEGSLLLCLYGSMLVDKTHHPHPEENKDILNKNIILLDVLTPIIKSWPSEWCLEANKWAIQIHGGYGYTRDFSVEQHYRDNRLNMIHEGTNGIQSLDLLGRKMTMLKGKGLEILDEEIRKDIIKAKEIVNKTRQQGMKSLSIESFGKQSNDNSNDKSNESSIDIINLLESNANLLESACNDFKQVTKQLTSLKDRNVMLANSHDYLNLTGFTVIAWMWLKQQIPATESLILNASSSSSTSTSSPSSTTTTNNQLSDDDINFYLGKIITSKYFFNHELTKTGSWLKVLRSLDVTNTQMADEYF